jgi:hypothetical protein
MFQTSFKIFEIQSNFQYENKKIGISYLNIKCLQKYLYNKKQNNAQNNINTE